MKLEIQYTETVHHTRTIEIECENPSNYELVQEAVEAFLVSEIPPSYDTLRNQTEKTYMEWTDPNSGADCFIEN